MGYSKRERERLAQANIPRYEKSSWYGLADAYGRYSYNKERAWQYCKNLMEKKDGYGLKIISKNTFIFTAGFEFTDPETGVVKFMYITPTYDTEVDYI